MKKNIIVFMMAALCLLVLNACSHSTISSENKNRDNENSETTSSKEIIEVSEQNSSNINENSDKISEYTYIIIDGLEYFTEEDYKAIGGSMNAPEHRTGVEEVFVTDSDYRPGEEEKKALEVFNRSALKYDPKSSYVYGSGMSYKEQVVLGYALPNMRKITLDEAKDIIEKFSSDTTKIHEEFSKIQATPDAHSLGAGQYEAYWLDSYTYKDRRKEIVAEISPADIGESFSKYIAITYAEYDDDNNIIKEELLYDANSIEKVS